MLFDLQGKRRRVVQATYLMLAVLMGGGLVLFGIGGDVSGGLFDAFSDRGGGSSSDNTTEKRIERNEEKLKQGGTVREAALQELVRDYYALANAKADPNTGSFGDEGTEDLEKAAARWQQYLKAESKNPSVETANYAVQVYDPRALNKPAEAADAQAIVAEQENDWPSYLRLVQYAALAGDTRTADLAGQKAIDLAKKGEKKDVRQQVKLAKQPAPAAAGGGTSTTGG